MFFKKNSKKLDLVNILTRSSNRPKGFHICHESVIKQTYKNIRHIVSVDLEKDLEYLKNYDIDIVKVDRENLIDKDESLNPNTGPYSPHNLYCNELLQSVNDGWVMFLDDDDMLANHRVIQKIVNKISKTKNNKDTIFIWQMKYPDGKILPPNLLMKENRVELYKIGSPCFMFHSKYANAAKWDGWKCSDFRFLKNLMDKIPSHVYMEKVFIQLNNQGGFGKKQDIV